MTYYTITGLGWGRGNTITESRTSYEAAQRRNFPAMTDGELGNAWGYTWEAPAGTTGFHHGVSGMYWEFDDKDGELADSSQRVAAYGNAEPL